MASCICQKDGNHGVLVRAMLLILAAHSCLPKALRRSFPAVQRKALHQGEACARGYVRRFHGQQDPVQALIAPLPRLIAFSCWFTDIETNLAQLGYRVHLVEWLGAFSCRPYLSRRERYMPLDTIPNTAPSTRPSLPAEATHAPLNPPSKIRAINPGGAVRLAVFGSLSVTSSTNANIVKITVAVAVPIHERGLAATYTGT